MDAKLNDFSEIAKILSSKNRVARDLFTLFRLFGIGHLLRRLSMEKHCGVSAVQLIISLCLFRVNGDSIYSIYKKDFYDLVKTGKNCYYRILSSSKMDWRRLMNAFAVRFLCILRKNHASESAENSCLILDDTTLEKTGKHIEGISKVFDHTVCHCKLGFKLLLCAFFDGKSTIPFDFSIHREKGKKKNYGLSEKDRRKQFSKKRRKENPDKVRMAEIDMSKLDVAIQMIKRAVAYGLKARYVLCDSWFTCEKLIEAVRTLGDGSVHFVGLAKMNSTKYEVHGKKHCADELVTLYEREQSHSCRKYKCRYITLKGRLGAQPVRIFLIHYGKKERWNILLTSDNSMSFIRAFELYQIRWNIEVINKETKNYLGLGKYQGRDFNGQIADATLCFLTYTVLVLEKRFSDYETMGELFASVQEDLMALTLWQRILSCIERMLEVLAQRIGMTAEELIADMIYDQNAAEDYMVMFEALKQRQEQRLPA